MVELNLVTANVINMQKISQTCDHSIFAPRRPVSPPARRAELSRHRRAAVLSPNPSLHVTTLRGTWFRRMKLLMLFGNWYGCPSNDSESLRLPQHSRDYKKRPGSENGIITSLGQLLHNWWKSYIQWWKLYYTIIVSSFNNLPLLIF